jgi:pimeloyl-ACP methyl ester carboxylesterase
MPFANVGADKIYYVTRGDASTDAQRGVPIVFVHGAASNHLIWGDQVRALNAIARTFAIDLPGHGKSSPLGRDSIATYRDVVLGFMDTLALDRAVIVGHSMGGAIAQTLALSHSERVAGLGLVGTGARLRVLPTILDGLFTDFESIAQLVVEYSYAPGLDATLRERALAEFRACPAQVTHGDFAACNAFDVMPRVAEIHAPTLIVCGKEDRLTPVKYSEFLASKIPNARLVLVEGAGHSVMMEQAEAVNRALGAFVSGLSW